MTSDEIRQPVPQFSNPVYPSSFPDPFVLKHNGLFFAYCTGHWHDGRVFGVLCSDDLITWTSAGGAMTELPDSPPFYWAPEVTYWNGTFYLYYSVGNETLMQLRVATSDRPDGGFEDSGVSLTKEDFAIDAHVHLTDDGQRYLFYATDFLDHSHIGTGVVVDRMLDWYTLEGKPRPVVRAKFDWQVYDPNRKEKGGVRWHTVEGPFVLKRKHRYYMMFSGGNWQQPTYGVSFAAAGDLETTGEWRQFSDGEKVLPILRTEPDKQVGPGHNSVVRGPNNRETYCVYHYWHEGERVLAVNRMDFAGPRIFIENKPYLPKPVPLLPSASFRLTEENWKAAGSWEFSGVSAKTSGGRPDVIRSKPLPESYHCEFSVRHSGAEGAARFGFRLECGTEANKVLGGFVLCLNDGAPAYEWIEGEGEIQSGPLVLGSGFRIDALHLICIEADMLGVCVRLDDNYLTISRTLASRPRNLSLFSIGETSFSAVELTNGYENRFESDECDPVNTLGWNVAAGAGSLAIQELEMILDSPGEDESIIYKGEAGDNFEFAANIRLKGPAEPGSSYGFVLLDGQNAVISRFEFSEIEGRFYLGSGSDPAAIVLPFDFNTRLFHQFRFRKAADQLYLDIETIPLGVVEVPRKRARMGVFGRNARVALEMARLTILDN